MNQVRFHANNNFELLPIVSTAFISTGIVCNLDALWCNLRTIRGILTEEKEQQDWAILKFSPEDIEQYQFI